MNILKSEKCKKSAFEVVSKCWFLSSMYISFMQLCVFGTLCVRQVVMNQFIF